MHHPAEGMGRALWYYSRTYPSTLLIAFGCMMVLGLCNGGLVYLIGPALRFLISGAAVKFNFPIAGSKVVPSLPRDTLLWAIPALVVIVSMVKGVAYLGQFYFMGMFGQKVAGDLRRRLLIALQELSPAAMSGQLTGDLMSRFSSDVAAVEVAATYTVGAYVKDSIQILALGCVIFFIQWQVALILAVLVPLSLLPVSRLTGTFLKRTKESRFLLGSLAAQIQEGLIGVKTLQAFNAQRSEKDRFAEQTDRQLTAFLRAAWARGAVPPLMEILAASAVAGIFLAALTHQFVLSENLISITAAVVMLYEPIKDLGRMGQFGLQGRVAYERIDDLLRSRRGDTGTRQFEHTFEDSIELQDIFFAYRDRQALAGVTLTLPKGKMTAVVGPSGGGKSTLINILLRFEIQSSGRMLIDGDDIAGMSVASVRSRFALVSQEPMLFSFSIAENIAVGMPGASPHEIEAAAKKANADGFINQLPDRYATLVGERGVRLSGGQRQRICLARALISKSPVLLLDEATSHLDPESEREVQSALTDALEGRTALVIAHRLRTVAHADCIYVLKEGRIVDRGTHTDLLARKGLYAHLWSLQESA